MKLKYYAMAVNAQKARCKRVHGHGIPHLEIDDSFHVGAMLPAAGQAG